MRYYRLNRCCCTRLTDNCRDIADTLLLARLEAEEDPTEANLEKLTDTHIIQTLADILFGKKIDHVALIKD